MAVLARINPQLHGTVSKCCPFFTPTTYLMVNMNDINVQCTSSGIQLHSAAPAAPTHRHSAPRPAAPSSETSVLEEKKRGETGSVCEQTTRRWRKIYITQGCGTKPVLLTISRSYGLNFHPHFFFAPQSGTSHSTTAQSERMQEAGTA